MLLKAVEVRFKPGVTEQVAAGDGGFAPGRQEASEVSVLLTFFGSPDEANKLAALLPNCSGVGSLPPREFWDALDYGRVD